MVALSGAGWALAPSLDLFVDEADDAFPNRDHSSDGSVGDLAHSVRESDHNPYAGWVHAVDLDENLKPGVTLEPMWRHLIAVRDKRVRYLIYEGRIVKSYTDSSGHPAWVPYAYTGINDHSHHMHVSIDRTATARNDLRPWGFAIAYAAPAPTPDQETPMADAYFASSTESGNVWFFEQGRRTLIGSKDRAQIAKALNIPNVVAELSPGFYDTLCDGRTKHQ